MVPLRPWLLLSILLRTAPTLACDAFTNPTLPDLSTTFTFGDKVDIHWDVHSLQYVDLILHHWGSNYISTLAHNQTNNGTFFWTIGKGDNVTAQVIKAQRNFVLVIQDPDGGAPSAACGWVDDQVQSPGFIITTTTSSSSTSATPTSNITTSSIIATTTTPAATTSAAAAVEEGGLSTSASAGIGAGIGAAVILFGAALGLFLFTRRKNAKKSKKGDGAQEQEKPDEIHGEPVQCLELSSSSKYEMDGSRPGYLHQGSSELTATMDSQELDGRAMAYELDSGDSVSRDSIRK